MHTNIFIPDDFLTKMAAILPNEQALAEFTAACQRPLRKSIRVNTLKISVAEFETYAEKNGWQLSTIPWCESGFWIEADESQTPLGNSAEHLAGLFYIQEASSMLPPQALEFDLNTQPRLLDCAAAPGSKTTQLAALMKNQGLLVANEYSSSRVKVLHANIERCGVRNCALTNYDARVFGGWLPEQFDAILLDAPCSGEGTIRKDEHAFKNWSLQSINAIAATQKDLIISAFQALKPGGTLVYSTCTLSQEENQHVCHFLKQTYPDAVEFVPLHDLFAGAEKSLTQEGFLHVFPHHYDSEGFFVARIRKTASVDAPPVTKRRGKFPFTKATSKQAALIENALHDALQITLPTGLSLWQRDKEVWLFPDALEALLGEIRFSRMGIKLAEAHKHGFRWQHQVATALADAQSCTRVELSRDDARQWYMGRDVRPAMPSGKGEVVVTYQHHPIGLGKWVGNRIKNGLPRERVLDKNLF